MDYVDYVIDESIFLMLGYLLKIVINVLVWVFIIRFITNRIRRRNNKSYFKKNVVFNKLDVNDKNNSGRTYEDVTKSQLARFNTEDIDTLKDYFYRLFIDFENAYNNLDYNMMKLLSTKQLYHNYYTGISLDLSVGRKRIISDIEKKKVIIFELDSTIAKQIASVMIEISYINYTRDKNGNVVSGNRDKKVIEKFEVMFRKDFEREDVVKCLNCGATVVGNKCEYCRTDIKNVEFKISSIKKIIDE